MTRQLLLLNTLFLWQRDLLGFGLLDNFIFYFLVYFIFLTDYLFRCFAHFTTIIEPIKPHY